LSGRLCLIAAISLEGLDRTLAIGAAVAQSGGSVVLCTYTPGLALRRTYFGLEVVVRRAEEPAAEMAHLGALARSRGGVLLLDDPRLLVEPGPEAVRVARYGPPALREGELAIDPFWPTPPGADPNPSPLLAGGCLGLRYQPIHPALKPLRDQRRDEPDRGARAEVARVTLACDRILVAARTLEALAVWRPPLQVAVLTEGHLGEDARLILEQAAARSRHQVGLRPLHPVAGPQLGEALLCDLAIVDDVERAATAAYLGTPALVLSTSAREAARAETLAAAGAAVHLTWPEPDRREPPPALYADHLWTLLADSGRRQALAAGGQRLLDAYGAQRVAAALFELSLTT
jgi:hypothetical protein